MARKRSDCNNEVKTRLDDRSYEALQFYKNMHGIESDSAALARITKVSLFGAVGTLPLPYFECSADLGRIGTEIAV
jgi:hypothetical protein